MTKMFRRFMRNDSGQDLIEYALLAGFVSLAVIATLILTGTALNSFYTRINTQIDSAAQPPK